MISSARDLKRAIHSRSSRRVHPKLRGVAPGWHGSRRAGILAAHATHLPLNSGCTRSGDLLLAAVPEAGLRPCGRRNCQRRCTPRINRCRPVSTGSAPILRVSVSQSVTNARVRREGVPGSRIDVPRRLSIKTGGGLRSCPVAVTDAAFPVESLQPALRRDCLGGSIRADGRIRPPNWLTAGAR